MCGKPCVCIMQVCMLAQQALEALAGKLPRQQAFRKFLDTLREEQREGMGEAPIIQVSQAAHSVGRIKNADLALTIIMWTLTFTVAGALMSASNGHAVACSSSSDCFVTLAMAGWRLGKLVPPQL